MVDLIILLFIVQTINSKDTIIQPHGNYVFQLDILTIMYALILNTRI